MRRIVFAFVALCSVLMAGAARPQTKFAWGADAGASIDLSGSDMSSVDFSAVFGLSRGWINFLGVGAEADIVVSSSSRSYPLFVNFKTNFRNTPSLLFWDLKAGLSLNYMEHGPQQTGFYGSTGLGVNLARSSKFCSHLVIAYTFRQRSAVEGAEMTHDFKSLSYASVKIGVTF